MGLVAVPADPSAENRAAAADTLFPRSSSSRLLACPPTSAQIEDVLSRRAPAHTDTGDSNADDGFTAFRLQPRRHNLRRALVRAWEGCRLQDRFRKKVAAIKMEMVVAKDAPKSVIVDRGRVYQLLTNIIGEMIAAEREDWRRPQLSSCARMQRRCLSPSSLASVALNLLFTHRAPASPFRARSRARTRREFHKVHP